MECTGSRIAILGQWLIISLEINRKASEILMILQNTIKCIQSGIFLSISTYQALKDNYGDILIEGEYKQGELACYYIKLSDGLIGSVLSGVERFLKEYCKLVPGKSESVWNAIILALLLYPCRY
jgi:hypothetical protein